MSNISLTNIKKRYGSFQAIHDLSLEIDEGEFVVLVGPSGCGKSTLLRMVAGLESVTGGQVRIGGRVVNDLMPRERDIAMVFQSYALYPHMTVAQNMGFSLKLDGSPKPEIDERVRAAAAILSLEPLLDRKPSQLSGGQRQRVAMGRAIVRSPQVFLFDEPLSNLDAKLRVQMRAEIKSLHNRLKTTVVYVTHDQVEAMTMADRIVVMNQGHIEQSGTPLDLYDNPVNRFVAGFLGSPAMNMIECILERDETGDALRLPDRQLLRIGDRRLPAEADARLILGIRPEHMRPAEQGAAGLDIRVHLQEPTGSHTLLIGLVGDTIITCEVPDRLELAQDDIVKVAYDTERLHFFDAETNTRLDT